MNKSKKQESASNLYLIDQVIYTLMSPFCGPIFYLRKISQLFLYFQSAINESIYTFVFYYASSYRNKNTIAYLYAFEQQPNAMTM